MISIKLLEFSCWFSLYFCICMQNCWNFIVLHCERDSRTHPVCMSSGSEWVQRIRSWAPIISLKLSPLSALGCNDVIFEFYNHWARAFFLPNNCIKMGKYTHISESDERQRERERKMLKKQPKSLKFFVDYKQHCKVSF